MYFMTAKEKEKMAENPQYRTALEQYNLEQRGAGEGDAFTVKELRDYGFIGLRGQTDDDAFVSICRNSGIVIPTAPLRLEYNGMDDGVGDGASGRESGGEVKTTQAMPTFTLWISPDEFLHLLPLKNKDALVSKLEEDLSATHAAVVDNSGGFSYLELGGSALHKVLAKTCAYDCNKENLPPGKVVSTLIGKAPVIIFRHKNDVADTATGRAGISLLIRFSFADYVWRLLEDAAGEYKSS